MKALTLLQPPEMLYSLGITSTGQNKLWNCYSEYMVYILDKRIVVAQKSKFNKSYLAILY